jgi:hypothetical protein
MDEAVVIIGYGDQRKVDLMVPWVHKQEKILQIKLLPVPIRF